MSAKNRAVFIEECIVRETVSHTVDPSSVEFRSDAVESMLVLAARGFKLFLLSRQPGVARGYFTIAQVETFLNGLVERLQLLGITIAGAYYCPHHPHGRVREYAVQCHCQKISPELFYRATLAERLTLRNSWLIGNELDHVEGALRAGCRTIMIYNGGEEKNWRTNKYRQPEYLASSISEATKAIVKESETVVLT